LDCVAIDRGRAVVISEKDSKHLRIRLSQSIIAPL
jgi:hypothetical protein